jgi:uncharacterized GH25 family protein
MRTTLFVAFAFASAAAAHDLHILGSKLRGAVNDETTIYVTWSHAQPVDEVVDDGELENYLLLGPSGSRRELAKKGTGLHANAMKLEEEGVYQAVAASKAKIVSKIAGKDGAHRHAPGGKTDVAKRDPQAKVVSATKSQQFSKALIVVGKATKTVDASGLPFDILPLDKPSQWKAGAKLRFQVLYNDAPLDSGKIAANPIGFPLGKDGADEERWAIEKSVGKDGVVEIAFDKPGRWLLQVERSFTPDAKHRAQFDREDYVTSLALEIQP